jgi:sugar lactone lactonase YvrE
MNRKARRLLGPRTRRALLCAFACCVLCACDQGTQESRDAALMDAKAPNTDGPADAEAALDGAAPAFDADVRDADARDADVRDATLAEDDASAAPDEATCVACCSDGFPRGTANSETRLVAHFTPSPEGVSVCPDGDLVVALDGNGELWRIPAAFGEPVRWGSVGDRQPAGVSCDERGRVFVAIYAVRGEGLPKLPTLALVTSAGVEPVLLPAPAGAAALSGLNGVVAVRGVGVYASDTGSQRIVLWREDPSGVFSAKVVADDVPMPNGLAYAPRTRTLYVATSLDQRVLSFAVAADGTLGPEAEALRGPDLLGFFDGVAVDGMDQLYAASFLSGRVLRGPTAQPVATVPSPASLAFRGGTLFITDYKFGAPESEGGLYAVDLGVCGPGR